MTGLIRRGVLMLAAAALAPAARAGDGCRPVYGFYTSSIQPSCAGALCTAGELIGALQADYAFVASGLMPASALSPGGDPALASALFYVGTSDVTLRSGDHVFASDSGVIDVGGTGKQAALLVVTGGTGAHAGATGFLQLRGSLENGQVAGDYLGEIGTP